MKKDFEFIKQILVVIENMESPIFTSNILATVLFEHPRDRANIDKLYLHIQLLSDANCVTSISQRGHQPSVGFIQSEVLGGPEITPVMFSSHNLRLTNNGYDLLDSLENTKVMDEIKKTGGKIAIESVIGIASSIGGAILTKAIGL